SMRLAPATSSIALGRSDVSVPIRVPLPAARMMAFRGPISTLQGWERGPGRYRRYSHTLKEVSLHPEAQHENGDSAVRPNLGKSRNVADHCLEQDEMGKERSLD